MGDKIIIVIESKNYEVSKSKLIEKSNYFNSMFNGDFLEKNESTITLKGIKVESWERILYYLENGKLQADVYPTKVYKKVLDLLEAASMLQFSEIQDRCARNLYGALEVDNALDILEVASKLDLEILIQKARAIALWNSDIITNSDAFFNLNADQVEGYLGDQALHSSSGEWGVWEAVNRWINSPPDFITSRTEYLPRLIKCVSLQRLNLSDLKTLSLNEIIRSSPLVSKVLRVLIEEKTSKSENVKQDETDKLRSSPKNDDCDEEQETEVEEFIRSWREQPPRRLPLVPAVIGNINQDIRISSPFVVGYSEAEGKFIPLLRLDEVETCLGALVGFKVIANGSKIYMLGGEIMTRQSSWYYAVWEYDQILKKWMFLANLEKAVRHFSACVLEDDLYVIGGFGRHRLIQDTVSKLSINDRTWTICAPLPRPMYSGLCCVFRGKIYVIQTQVYQYSPERDCWTTLDISLPAGHVFSNVAANNDYIFLSGISRSVYKFNPSLPSVTLEEVGKFNYECSQACLIEEYIYSMSQEDFDPEIYCEKINILTGECTVLWKGLPESNIANLSSSHRHGCFPLLLY